MYVKRRHGAWLLLGGSAIAAAATVWAQTGGGYDASFTVFDSAGKQVSGGSYVLQTGVGQPMAGTVAGSGYSLDIGVLAGGVGAAGSPTPGPIGPYERYVPQVAKD